MTRAIIFPKISVITYLISIILRYLNKNNDIYFINISDYFKDHPSKINYLDKNSIKWAKKLYQSYSEHARGDFLSHNYVDLIDKEINKSSLIKSIDRLLSISGELKIKIDILWKKNIHHFAESFAYQYALGEFLTDNMSYKKVVIVSSNTLTSIIKKHIVLDKNITVIVIPGMELFEYCFKKLQSFALLDFIKKIFINKFNLRNKADMNTSNTDSNINCADCGKYEIAYFPHQGIFFGNFFAKDHFYSEDGNSPLYRSNILHISINEANKQYMANSHQYYQENNIPYIDINNLPCNNWLIYKKCLRLIIMMKFKLIQELCKYGADFIAMALLTLLRILKYNYILSSLSNLKIAFVGYEILFPRELAMALSLAGVKICACQERFITAFSPETGMSYYFLDYYFVAGKIVTNKGLKRHFIHKCLPVGLVRVDNLYEYEKRNLPDIKYDLIKKDKKLIIALDYPVPYDEIEDVNRQVGKIAQLRTFYNDLIKTALNFPSIHIVIKGKGTESYNSPFIADIVNKIREIDNIDIELDLNKYNPSYIIEKADLTIACQTSLADELLAAGRKVIFYELSNYLNTIFNYNNLPIIVSNYDELAYHINNFINGIYLDNAIVEEIQREFYSNCYHGKVRNKIQDLLVDVLKDNKSI